jgi:hypothetical protein
VDPGKKGNIVYVVVVAAALAIIWYFGADYHLGGVAISSGPVEPSATVEGEVLSIETVSGMNPPERKDAVVKLASGETVRALIPPACVVFPGQVAKLSRYGYGAVSFYVLQGAKEKE